MKRRPRGTGTITQMANGRFRATFPFEPGKRGEAGIYPTLEEAELALDAILAELRDAGQVPRAGLSLKTWGPRVLDRREREGYRSIDSQRSLWNAYLSTWPLADAPMRVLKRSDVRELLAKMRSAKKLSVQTRRNARNLLSAILAAAEEAGHVTENVCAGIKVKETGATHEKSTWLKLDELTRLLEASKGGGDTHDGSHAIAVAAGCGIRSGELVSLEWVDVHLDDASPHAVIRFGKPGKPRKNGRLYRADLFGIALDALKELKATRGRNKLVFPTVTGLHRQPGRVVAPEDWKGWLAKAGITRRVRWHDLRHTCATLLLNGDWGRAWSYEEVKEQLDHSSVKVTERYARNLGTRAGKAAAEMRIVSASKAHAQSRENAKSSQKDERCGSDSNRRLTVLQTHANPITFSSLDTILRLSRAYLTAVARGEAMATRIGVDLADAVLALGDAALLSEVRAEGASA